MRLTDLAELSGAELSGDELVGELLKRDLTDLLIASDPDLATALAYVPLLCLCLIAAPPAMRAGYEALPLIAGSVQMPPPPGYGVHLFVAEHLALMIAGCVLLPVALVFSESWLPWRWFRHVINFFAALVVVDLLFAYVFLVVIDAVFLVEFG